MEVILRPVLSEDFMLEGNFDVSEDIESIGLRVINSWSHWTFRVVLGSIPSVELNCRDEVIVTELARATATNIGSGNESEC